MTITNAEIDSAIPVAGTPSRSLTNALLKTFAAEQQADFRVTVGGRYYPVLGTVWATSGAPTADTIYFTPMPVRVSTTIDRLAIRILTGVALGEVQLAVYAASATTGLPTGSALATSGVQGATAATMIDATVSGVTLAPGMYWFALQGNNTTLRWVAVANTVGTMVGEISGTDTASAMFNSSGGMSVLVTASQAYGTWPTNPTTAISGSTSGLAPLGAYRVTP